MADLSRVLIFGADGLIGSELDFGIKISRQEADVTSVESIRAALEKYKPSVVLNLASVNLRDCQKDPYRANEVNVLGTYNLASETKKKGIGLIIISTGAIFSGEKDTIFNEKDTPSPLNIYGQTKYLAEIIARKENEKSSIIRTGWLFGFKKKQNFFNKILESALSGKEINATYDQTGSFTYVKDLIAELKNIISHDMYGIHHVVNHGIATAFDFAEKIIKQIGSSSDIKKISIEESEKEGILRSRSEALASNINIRNWEEALIECLRDSNAS